MEHEFHERHIPVFANFNPIILFCNRFSAFIYEYESCYLNINAQEGDLPLSGKRGSISRQKNEIRIKLNLHSSVHSNLLTNVHRDFSAAVSTGKESTVSVLRDI